MKKISIPILIFVAVLAVYVYNLAPGVTGNGDAGELVTAAYYLGIPHPPSFPLFVMVAHLFTLLPFGSIAHRVNLLSAVCQSFTAVFVYLTMLHVTKRKLVAVLTALTLAFSYNFFYSSLVSEVFPLNDLISSAIIYLLVTILSGYELVRSKVAVLGALLGLGMANHQTIILFLPAVAYAFWPLIRIQWEKSPVRNLVGVVVLFGLFFGVGMLPYLFLLWRGRFGEPNPLMWVYPQNFSDLFKLASREVYGSFTPILNYEPAATALVDKLSQLSNLLRFLVDDFMVVGLLLALFGLFWGMRQFRRVTIFLLIAFLFTGPLFLLYANFPFWASSTVLEIVERFYLLPVIVLSLFIGLGFNFVLSFAAGKMALRYIALPAVILYVFYLTFFNMAAVSQRDYDFTQQFVEDIYSEVKPGALLTIAGDIPGYAAIYMRYVEGFRADTEIVSTYTISGNDRYLGKVRPGLFAAGTRSGAVKLGDPSFTVQSLGDLPKPFLKDGAVGSSSGFLTTYYLPERLPPYAQWRSTAFGNAERYRARMENFIKYARNISLSDDAILDYYAGTFINIATNCDDNGDFDCVQAMYANLLSVMPENLAAKLKYAVVLTKYGKCDAAAQQYTDAFKLQPRVKEDIYLGLSDVYRRCYKDNKKAEMYFKMSKSENLRETL